MIETIHLIDYPGELSTSKYKELINSEEWIAWKKKAPGHYYFYKTDMPISSPIIFFTYENDAFLVPLQYTEELGLFHDFVID
jgi:hypothetical protein